MNLSLAIVVPALDESGCIAATLEALQPMRRRGAELVVADGGSSDGTPTIAAPLADRVLATPRGRARQLNAGAAAGCGEVLLFVHADTQLPADADRLLLEGLARSGRAWGRFDARIVGRSRLLPMVAAAMNLRSRLSGIATGDQAIFVTRAAFDAVGGFPDQPLMEDVEISRRLKRVSRPLCLRAAVCTSGRRWDDRGPWRTMALMWRLRLFYALGVPAARLAEWYR